jgi:tetratricopeptide (TPR) repeat protein
MAREAGDLEEARSLFEEAYAINRQLHNRIWEAASLITLASLAWEEGDYPRAAATGAQGLEAFREQHHPWGIAYALYLLGRIATSRGDLSSAWDLQKQSLSLQQELGDKQGAARSELALGCVARDRGDGEEARYLFIATLRDAHEAGASLECAEALERLAEMLAASQPVQAVQLVGAASVIRETADIASSLRAALGLAPALPERERLERCLGYIRSQLGDEYYTEAWQLGRSRKLEQLVGETLGVKLEPSA